ncbi:MAG: branched-chain amino acid ABC transporter permease [Alphaproteobacteria bacterium]|nr:branched-chain amino acid ABC transporter permease [Alphaproteobacteria bacterium]
MDVVGQIVGFLFDPLKEIWEFPLFFAEVVVGGLLTGVLYSLIALGFVLIFKASGVFNFAQGAMVLFAALCFIAFLDRGLPAWAAFVGATLVMVVMAFAIERTVLRPLVNQAPIILFMATIGLTFVIEGLAQVVWGSDVRRLDIGIPRDPIEIVGVQINKFDIIAGITAIVLVSVLGFFFQYTRVGRALRAVADDNQAALSVGIPLKEIWVYVWSVAGFVALVTGIIWGSKLGVQFSLVLIALKALPVLILGGFTSIPGAIVGGLIIGAGEKVAEVYWGPNIGGAVEDWFAYVVALLFLMVRPQGLFGERIIERV